MDWGELSMELPVMCDCMDQRLTFRWGMLAAVCDRMAAVDEGVYGLAADIDVRGVREPEEGVKRPEASELRFFFGRRSVRLGFLECSAGAW
jgi:hypothetical protein